MNKDNDHTLQWGINRDRRSGLDRTTQAFNQLSEMSDIAMRKANENYSNRKKLVIKPVDIDSLNVGIKKAIHEISLLQGKTDFHL